MEKPQNYFLRAKVAIIVGIIFLLFTIVPIVSILFPPSVIIADSLFVNLFFALLVAIMAILCLMRGVQFKDKKYIILAVLLLVVIPIGYILFDKVGSHLISKYNPIYF